MDLDLIKRIEDEAVKDIDTEIQRLQEGLGNDVHDGDPRMVKKMTGQISGLKTAKKLMQASFKKTIDIIMTGKRWT